MPDLTPILGLPKPLGNETHNRTNHNALVDAIEANAQKKIVQAAAAPTNPAPVIGDLWVDTSSTPNIVKRYDGSVWVKLTPTVPADIAAAPLASPALTGTPTAPTAAVDTATTQLATTAFVTGQGSTTTPVMDGVATVGTSKRYAREDHKHPSDTSRASTADLTTHAALTTHKQVSNVIQSGNYSNAEGSNTTASGSYSHAEGYATNANGTSSHAEGYATNANGDYSHAEGNNTIASGNSAHAEGTSTVASGSYSHAQGRFTLAIYGALYTITAFDNVAKTITLDKVTGLVVGDLLTIKVTDARATENIPITAISGLVVTLNTTLTIASNWKYAIEQPATMYPTHAEGSNTTASGSYSHAEGSLTVASGTYSHAEGYSTTANGSQSHVEGASTTASGTGSHAEGQSTAASGNYAHAEGNSTTASGFSSHAENQGTTSSGSYSHAEGGYSVSSGNYSHTQNLYTIAQGYAQTAVGSYNAAQGTTTTKATTDNAFIIGNGTDEATRANAFRVTWAGAAYGLSAYNSTGADYSEFFEWLDGNSDNEDRVGYFVTLEGEMIRKADSSDDYILGIVSAAPAIVGDSHNDDWQGRYVTDVWGRRQTHEVVVPAVYETRIIPAILDAKGKIVTAETTEQVEIMPEHTDTVFVQNPDWNPDAAYIPRDDRQEWSTVGMLGKLFVRDDGTCEVNGYCKSDDNGLATACETGYRVMRRVADNIVQVLLK